MDFPMLDEKEGRYAHIFPVGTDGNTDLRQTAEKAGDVKMVGWRGKGEEARWRLFEDRIPKNIDPDETFAKFLTPEAEKAFMAERAVKLEASKKVENAVSSVNEAAAIPQEKLYYPVTGKERDDFNKLIAQSKDSAEPTIIRYNDKVGAYVHKSGPTEGFERWQTPEAKSAWEAHGRVKSEKQSRSASRAREVAEHGGIVDNAGKGKTFVAEHINGLKLPSSVKYEKEHKAMVAGIKAASNEEIETVFAKTKSELQYLERKLFAMQISGAEKRGVSKEAFEKMNKEERRKASGFADLSAVEFSNLVALKNGFFKLNDERQERGVFKSVEEARALKEGSSVSAEGGAPKANDEQKKAVQPEEPAKASGKDEGAKPAGRSKSKGAAAVAALVGDLGR